MLRRLDGVRLHALEVDAAAPACSCVSTGHEPPGAHLHRLLHHVVEPRMLQRREEIVEVGQQASARARCSSTTSTQPFRPASAIRARHSPSRPLKRRIGRRPSAAARSGDSSPARGPPRSRAPARRSARRRTGAGLREIVGHRPRCMAVDCRAPNSTASMICDHDEPAARPTSSNSPSRSSPSR